MTTPPVPADTPAPAIRYNLINAFTACLIRYAKFSGRACRSEYWFWILATALVSLIPLTCDFVVSGVEAVLNDNTPFSDIYNLATLLPGLAVFVRRMHDIGRSAWNLLWWFLPIIGWIVCIIYCCQPTGEANKYGEGPDAPTA